MQVVEDFTSKKLTISSDRLPAMGGIADVIGANLGDDYLAGL